MLYFSRAFILSIITGTQGVMQDNKTYLMMNDCLLVMMNIVNRKTWKSKFIIDNLQNSNLCKIAEKMRMLINIAMVVDRIALGWLIHFCSLVFS